MAPEFAFVSCYLSIAVYCPRNCAPKTRAVQSLKERDWPAPIIDFHLGKIDEKVMFAVANDLDPKTKR